MSKKNSLSKNQLLKLGRMTENSVVFLTIIGVTGLLIRIYYFPHDIPIVLDGLSYFWYATDMSLLGQFPTGYSWTNNGWPTFLSLFFSISNSSNFMDYMVIQRSLTMIISVLTIIPVYFLCVKFFDKKYALFGSALFAFEPRLIQNSLLGNTEPLFVLLTTMVLAFLISQNKKIVYVSFAITALATLVRYEGFLLIIPTSIIFLIRFRKERKIFFKFLFSLSIFILVLLPMTYIRIQTVGQDGFLSQIIDASLYVSGVEPQDDSRGSPLPPIEQSNFIKRGIVGLIQYGGWMTIPSFIIFLPYGILNIFKKIDYKKLAIIIFIIILLIPAFYAYGREYDETKYLLVIVPLFCLLSLFTIQRFENKFKKSRLFTLIFLLGILLSSVIFLEYKKIDYVHEREAFIIAQNIVKKTKVINDFYPEAKYVSVATLVESNFPVLSNSNLPNIKILSIEKFNSVENFIELGTDKGLTHLIIDNNENRPVFFKEIFIHEEKYPYLIKVYDSTKSFNYKVKIYKIDYQKFELEFNN